MALRDELRNQVNAILSDQWTERNGTVVPESGDLRLGNDAVKLTGTVLYADLSASTRLVDTTADFFAAEVYKSYLYCAAKLVRAEQGSITAYDGDRIMAVFIGEGMQLRAVRAALKLTSAVQDIINPLLLTRYPRTNYQVEQTVGVDCSSLFVARTGIRGANDLVWVGSAANHAAKLTSLPPSYPTRITQAVFDQLPFDMKYKGLEAVWQSAPWVAMAGRTIYGTTWKYTL